MLAKKDQVMSKQNCYVDLLKEKFEKSKQTLYDLGDSDEDFDLLYSTDLIYIVKGSRPDDNNLTSFRDHFETRPDWISKLRGPYNGPPKLSNLRNDTYWFHGYIMGVSHDNEKKFDEDIMGFMLKTGYIFEKISVLDIKNLKKEIENQYFNELFG